MEIEVYKNCLLRCVGDPANQLLLLVPGFADNGTMFTGLFSTPLVERFRLVAVDLPGFGSSPRNVQIQTLQDFGLFIAELATELRGDRQVGIVGHSVASIISVHACERLQREALGLFSIEGNLTSADAYFSGKAADHARPDEFKAALLREIWARAAAEPILRRYCSSILSADSDAMWLLGNDLRHYSADVSGQQFIALQLPKLVYWSPANVPDETRQWIKGHPLLPNLQFHDSTHWPTVDRPSETAKAIGQFFERKL